MEQPTNTVTVRGYLLELPQFSHENHGRRFYRFSLGVPRLSGTADLLPVIAEESLVMELDPNAGTMIWVKGQIRSHNRRSEKGRHLHIFIFATALQTDDGEALNEAQIEGVICKPPVYRRTPLGREICDIMLAVSRAFHRADYLPCILWGRTAQQISLCSVGDRLQLLGRLQSRSYTKQTPEGIEERTAYELSALSALVLPDIPEAPRKF